MECTKAHVAPEKILSVSHYSIIANVIQKSTHFNAPPPGFFSPGEVSLGGGYFTWYARGRTALTWFNATPSSIARSL